MTSAGFLDNGVALVRPDLHLLRGGEPKTAEEQRDAIKVQLSAFFNAQVERWNAYNVSIYHKSDKRKKLGGALIIKCQILGEEGVELEKRIEIDDNNRPLPEDMIAELGAVAAASPPIVRTLCT